MNNLEKFRFRGWSKKDKCWVYVPDSLYVDVSDELASFAIKAVRENNA